MQISGARQFMEKPLVDCSLLLSCLEVLGQTGSRIL